MILRRIVLVIYLYITREKEKDTRIIYFEKKKEQKREFSLHISLCEYILTYILVYCEKYVKIYILLYIICCICMIFRIKYNICVYKRVCRYICICTHVSACNYFFVDVCARVFVRTCFMHKRVINNASL